jgi:ribosomal peptide maturation radical SAM protein 1
MPFAVAGTPSIQLGLLSELARRAGYRADCYHLNLDLAARMRDMYDAFSEYSFYNTGEWLFSTAAFGDAVDPDVASYLEVFPRELARLEKRGKDAEYLQELRDETLPRFIEDCLEMAPWPEYDLVGFSSTYQQNVASLALARRIKETWPGVKIVFGGANMQGEMGPATARAFPFIDYVVVGEGDQAFPLLLNAIEKGDLSPKIPGLVSRSNGHLHDGGMAPPVHELDELPTPNYEEYFERYRTLGFPRFRGTLVFESSRGCWWGRKQHCTFCGLEDVGLTYRRKSVERVLGELAELSRKYRVTAFQAADNILEIRYINTLFREIEEKRYDYQFFYEVKASLTREQIRQLRAGGVRWIQPGIESMNTRILQLMKKGSSMLQNVRLLKWAAYYRIRTGWNLLWGFPGERASDFEEEYRVLELLTFLEPPVNIARIRMDRFSPIFEDREAFPAKWTRPAKSYEFVYPANVELEKLVYFYDYEFEDATEHEVHAATEHLVKEWKDRWSNPRARPRLVFRRTEDRIFIDDSRPADGETTHSLEGVEAAAYEFCSDTMRTVDQVADHIAAELGPGAVDASGLQGILAEFCERGLMVSEAGKYLSLAHPAFTPPVA